MELDAVLFDLDATLIDRRASLASYARRMMADFRRHAAGSSVQRAVKVVQRADGDGYRDRAGFFAEVLASAIWNEPPDLAALSEHFFRVFGDLAELSGGAAETLRLLRDAGLKLGIVTNGSEHFQARKLDASGLRSLVDDAVISGAVGCQKPDRAIFDLALDRLDVRAGRSCFVGDHPVNDVVGASEAGLMAIWLEGTHPWPEGREPPVLRVSTLSEVPAKLGLAR